ncbi:ABC transporter ATP-binding protein [Acrocarpospora catenulata]|uniref:ABC transporter ATP-binding protein n=1 Tax=Acrocarpospora catenulata TaxID=2836182 RepID=UPI001BDABD15|nr:ABC transporter ATP-binding protein [Acrocarpospora catenulata]
MNPILQVEKIAKQYGGLRAVDDVSLTLELGEVVGLIGPNGSGKTTFVNLITGYVEPTSGTVTLGGTDVTARSPHRLAQAGVGRTYQVPRLFSSLSIVENIEAALLFVRRQPQIWRVLTPRTGRASLRREAIELLDMVGMAHVADRGAASLSLGESRRVEIARGLAAARRILVLDEPVAGLQGEDAMNVGRLIAETARARDIGVIVIEHNVPLVRRFCDRLVVLNLGRVIAAGPCEDVVRMPQVVEAYIGKEASGSHGRS